MKEALVIHPRFTLYGGGEVVGLHVCKVLQGLGYHVNLACDNFNPAEADRHLGLGSVMEKCAHVKTSGEFKPLLTGRFLAYQRAIYEMRRLNSTTFPANCEFVFSTQSMVYFRPNLLNFCITYDLADFFYASALLSSISKESKSKAPYYYPLRWLYHRYASRMSEKENYFIPLSRAIEESIEALHYPHSHSVFPPCEMLFKVQSKQKYVVNASRIVPHKRLEDFVDIARRLPKYKFVIVGKMSKTEEALFPGYKRKLLDSLPPNVTFVEALILEVKELVERARIYLYPSTEPGVNISLGQAMGAGCIPITPPFGGGAEMVDASGTGYVYSSLADAPAVVERAMESYAPRDQPEHIAERARIFGADSFDEQVRSIIEGKIESPLLPQ